MFLATDSSWYTTLGGTPGLVAALLGLIIARYYWRKGKETKQLDWVPHGITRIVTRPVGNLSKGLALTWNGDPLETPYTVKVKILNTGTREISRDKGDRETYHEPLSVEFSQSVCYEAVIIGASSKVVILDSSGSPVPLPLTVISSPQRRFDIQMPALNRRAWIELQMIADGKVEYPRIRCILSGEARQIRPVASRQHSLDTASLRRYIGMGAFILSAGLALYGYQSLTLQSPTFWPITLMVIGPLFIFGASAVYIWAWLLDRQELKTIKHDDPNVFEPSRKRQWFQPSWRHQ